MEIGTSPTPTLRPRRAYQTLTCSLAQAKQALVTQNDGSGAATIDTVAVSKGRDDSWAGAVDALRINNKVYNFEPYGVLVSGS